MFVRDTLADTTTLVSRANGAAGAAGDGTSCPASISADGRFVAFGSNSTNLAGDSTTSGVYVRDLQNATTKLVSRASGPTGTPAQASTTSTLSGDGRYVAFQATGTRLTPDAPRNAADVYLRDTLTDVTTLISRASGPNGAPANSQSTAPVISTDGRAIAFDSFATNLTSDAVANPNVFLRMLAGSEPAGEAGGPATGTQRLDQSPPSATPTLGSKVPVVLVGGLREENPRVLPSNEPSATGVSALNCRLLVDFKKLCVTLSDAGHPVYVMPGARGSRRDDVLDTTGAVDANARKLAGFIRATVPGPSPLLRSGPAPLLIGHSMGGLIAHQAISTYGARASGLFTIGTPHTGSYGADVLIGLRDVPCWRVDVRLCAAVKTAALAAISYFGRSAVQDLTSDARRIANQLLRPAPGKTWVVAGTACTYTFISDAYWSPNDGIVGLSSALGVGASLGTVMTHTADVWHTVSSLLATAPSGLQDSCDPWASGVERPNEFTDDSVVSKTREAADSLDTSPLRVASSATRRTVRRGSSALATSATPPRPTVRIKLALRTGKAARLRPGARLNALGADNLIAARSPFSLSCGTKLVPALRLFSSDLYATDVGLAGCKAPSLVTRRPLAVMLTDNRARAFANLAIRGSRLTVTLTARTAIRRAVLVAGKRRWPTRTRRHGPQRLTLTARAPRQGRTQLTLQATVGAARYSASIPNP